MNAPFFYVYDIQELANIVELLYIVYIVIKIQKQTDVKSVIASKCFAIYARTYR